MISAILLIARNIPWNYLLSGPKRVISYLLRPMTWPVFNAPCSIPISFQFACNAENLSTFWLQTRGATPILMAPREASNVVVEENQSD